MDFICTIAGVDPNIRQGESNGRAWRVQSIAVRWQEPYQQFPSGLVVSAWNEMIDQVATYASQQTLVQISVDFREPRQSRTGSGFFGDMRIWRIQPAQAGAPQGPVMMARPAYQQPQMGGFQQQAPQMGGFQQQAPQMGGYQQQAPQMGGFQQQAPQMGGFQQQAPQMGGFGGTIAPGGNNLPPVAPAGGSPIQATGANEESTDDLPF